MKNRKVLVFPCTAIASRQISKRRSTSAARNSALNTPYPLCHTYSEQIAMKRPFFGLFLEPRLYSKIKYFQNLSVMGGFYAFVYLQVIDIHKVRCLESFLPLYDIDHFESFWFLTGSISCIMYLVIGTYRLHVCPSPAVLPNWNSPPSTHFSHTLFSLLFLTLIVNLRSDC